jgi:hypothetical protein
MKRGRPRVEVALEEAWKSCPAWSPEWTLSAWVLHQVQTGRQSKAISDHLWAITGVNISPRTVAEMVKRMEAAKAAGACMAFD